MEKELCDICGRKIETGTVVMHRIVPEEVTQEAGLADSGTVVLCLSCHDELQTWYSKAVFSMAYNAGTKRFIPRSAAEIVKEYEAAYRAFAAYKKRRRRKRGT